VARCLCLRSYGMAFRCSLCQAALPNAWTYAVHMLTLHADPTPPAVLPAGVSDLRKAAAAFRLLPVHALKLLWYYLEEAPNPHRFDFAVLRNEGIHLDPDMPKSSSTIRRWLRAKLPTAPLRTNWLLPYVDPVTSKEATVHVPCVDFDAAMRLLFLNRFVGWVIATEGARCTALPRAWNWIPNARRSALVEQHPHLGYKFGVRGAGGLRNRGRNGPWLLYFDGARAFEKSKNANLSPEPHTQRERESKKEKERTMDGASIRRPSLHYTVPCVVPRDRVWLFRDPRHSRTLFRPACLLCGGGAGLVRYNFYATRADYPEWFRSMESAWLWLAAVPVPVVKAMGLSRVLSELAQRLFPDGCSTCDVWDEWHGELARVESFCVGFVKDYEAELDVMGLRHGNARGNWLCWMCQTPHAGMRHGTLLDSAGAVRTCAELEANPNCTPVTGAMPLRDVVAALPTGAPTPDSLNLRNFVLFEGMHCMFYDGLLDKIVLLSFHHTDLRHAKLKRHWLRPWQAPTEEGDQGRQERGGRRTRSRNQEPRGVCPALTHAHAWIPPTAPVYPACFPAGP
jgi:hypothetical protein